jgi:hypothetical protein
VVDADSQHFLWTALHWTAVTLNQAERVRASFERFQVSRRRLLDGVVVRVTAEMKRPAAIFWADVHFLMIAVNHLDGVLQKLGPNGPRLEKALGAKAVELRHLLEHWEKAQQGLGAWKGYREKHGPHAAPAQVQFEPGESGDLRIGADPLSVVALAADVRRVEGELIKIEVET